MILLHNFCHIGTQSVSKGYNKNTCQSKFEIERSSALVVERLIDFREQPAYLYKRVPKLIAVAKIFR